VIHLYDGDSATPINLANELGDDFLSQQVQGVTGSGPDDVFVAFNFGLAHYNGVNWGVVPQGQGGAYIQSVGPRRAFVHNAGRLADVSPEGFRVQELPVSSAGAWSDGSNLFYFVAGPNLYRHTGSQWDHGVPNILSVTALAGDGNGGFVAVGAMNQIARTAGMADWVHACDGSLAVFTAGCGGQEPTTNYVAVWASPTDFVALTDVGASLHGDGDAETVDNTGTGMALAAIDGPSKDDLYAAGDNGTLVHYGSGWTVLSSGTSAHLRHIDHRDGTTWVVGDGGTVLSLSDDVATAVDLGLAVDFRCAWLESATVGFIGDSQGNIYRVEDGVATSLTAAPDGGSVTGLGGTSASDLFVGTDAGNVYHFDGSILSPVRLPLPTTKVDAMVSSGTEVLITGDNELWELARFNPW